MMGRGGIGTLALLPFAREHACFYQHLHPVKASVLRPTFAQEAVMFAVYSQVGSNVQQT